MRGISGAPSCRVHLALRRWGISAKSDVVGREIGAGMFTNAAGKRVEDVGDMPELMIGERDTNG